MSFFFVTKYKSIASFISFSPRSKTRVCASTMKMLNYCNTLYSVVHSQGCLSMNGIA